ncbi:hypothetical protein [Halomonas elongata]|uniref:hypothetical protein n=1 Tax=Halomonas elongata TaxID=2746 RepID=UPI00186BB109|nr:hypothetical protein [Halomonas elongata]MBW5799004.1 hypothetical protein [Halomonas elongata]
MSRKKGVTSSEKENREKSDNDLAVTLRNIGIEFYKEGDHASALSAMEVAFKLKPNSPFLRKRVDKLRTEVGGIKSGKLSQEEKKNDAPFPQRPMKTVSQDHYVSAYEAFRKSACEVWSAKYEAMKANYCNLGDVVAKIETAYKNNESLSVIRSGDGEGSLLYRFSSGYDEELFYLCARGSLRLHFGPQNYKYDDLFFWANELLSAFMSSDVITSARNGSAVDNLLSNDHEFDFRSKVGQLAGSLVPHSIALNNGRAIYPTGHLHRDLIPCYKDLFYGKTVILIGPNGNSFAKEFSEYFGCEVSDIITIPGQYIVEKGELKRSLYPDFYQKTLLDIFDLQLKGKLCLVGAGLAGKVYCSKIAAMGGVALDVGSMMDAWAGKKARKYHSSSFLERSSVSKG